MQSENAPDSVPPLEAMPPAGPEEITEPTAAEMAAWLKSLQGGARDVSAMKIALLRQQVEFLGENPAESDDKEQFVMRLVRYSLAQSAVIDAQNDLLSKLGII